MDPIIIETILGMLTFAVTLASVYGAFKKNRFLILLGFFISGIIVTNAELTSYDSTGNVGNLKMAGLFIVQMFLSYPNKIAPYDSTNAPAYYLGA